MKMKKVKLTIVMISMLSLSLIHICYRTEAVGRREDKGQRLSSVRQG